MMKDSNPPNLRYPLVMLLVMALLSWFLGCANVQPPPRKAQCHVLRADESSRDIKTDAGNARMRRWLAWCAEGRYVLFTSSVAPGQVIDFDEYQEDDELQIYGRIGGTK